ncbi:uncharacterized protein LOC122244114 [Penaeus japonicus]|uniref:uncharacterized protein LOC122244114 n=1 Tax=Penaeus japonicus TaxID=27405 RepID=UPI001C714FBC|nr:uncharacterized protein LOC122244114 [Penaeus japonicus]
MNNDISLLKLAKTLTFSDAVSPVCLTPSVLVFFQEKAMVIGWGKKNEKDNYGTSILNKAEVKVIPMLSCRHDYKFIPEMITSRMFCAAGETTDGCQGDSGGPLVWKDPKKNTYVQIGVTSWGIGCGRKDFPGVYVKLIKFLDWIYKQTSDSVFCSSFSPTADVEISSNGKKKQNNNKGKKKNKRNRKRNKFRRRRRRKKKGNRWRRRKEGNRWRGKLKRRTFSQEDGSDEDNENESVENKERRNYNEGESSEEDYETKYEGKRGRKRTNAKRRKGKLRKRQKQEDSRKEDNQDELKENGNNRRGYLYRKRKPKVEKLRNKRKSRDERTIDANGSIDYNGKIRSGSFKKDFPNGKSFSGDE